MFYFFSKLLSFVTSPAFWLMLLLLLALFSKQKKRKKHYLLSAVLFFYVLGNVPLQHLAIKAYAAETVSKNALPKTTYAVLLSGYYYHDIKNGQSHLNQDGDRLYQAIELYHHGAFDKLILSGASGSDLLADFKEPLIARAFLMAQGIPDSAIICEIKSRNTHESAVEVANRLGENTPVILLTSALHMPRSKACFQKEGLKVHAYPSNTVVLNEIKFSHFILPRSMVFAQWQAILHEWIGFFAYKISGYA